MPVTENAYRRAARRLYEVEGELEVDEDAVVSRADDEVGAYVQCWVWVYDDELTEEERESDVS